MIVLSIQEKKCAGNALYMPRHSGKGPQALREPLSNTKGIRRPCEISNSTGGPGKCPSYVRGQWAHSPPYFEMFHSLYETEKSVKKSCYPIGNPLGYLSTSLY